MVHRECRRWDTARDRKREKRPGRTRRRTVRPLSLGGLHLPAERSTPLAIEGLLPNLARALAVDGHEYGATIMNLMNDGSENRLDLGLMSYVDHYTVAASATEADGAPPGPELDYHGRGGGVNPEGEPGASLPRPGGLGGTFGGSTAREPGPGRPRWC
jgi:hypothetical protein